MKKLLVVLAFAMLAVMPSAFSQGWGLGARFGYWDGTAFSLDVKKYNGGNALEFIGSFYGDDAFEVAGLYEWNKELGNGFNFYYGCGASLGMWPGNKHNTDFGLGIDGILGVEWFLPNNIPFSLALDWMPQLRLIPSTGFWGNFSFTVKYVF